MTARTMLGCLIVLVIGFGCADTRSISDEPESAPVPTPISAFLAGGAGVTVQVYKLGGLATATSTDVFNNREVVKVVMLNPEQASRVVALLREPATYSYSHVGCVGAEGSGFSLRLERRSEQLDIHVDTVCDHLFTFDSPMNHELGLLSIQGKHLLEEAVSNALR